MVHPVTGFHVDDVQPILVLSATVCPLPQVQCHRLLHRELPGSELEDDVLAKKLATQRVHVAGVGQCGIDSQANKPAGLGNSDLDFGEYGVLDLSPYGASDAMLSSRLCD